MAGGGASGRPGGKGSSGAGVPAGLPAPRRNLYLPVALAFLAFFTLGGAYVTVTELSAVGALKGPGAKEAVGKVIQASWTKSGYSVRYQFDVPGDGVYVNKDDVEKTLATSLSAGARVELVYYRQDPRVARLKANLPHAERQSKLFAAIYAVFLGMLGFQLARRYVGRR